MSTPSTLILAVALVAAAFLISGRYVVVSAGENVMIVDRLTGKGWSCMPVGACFELDVR